MTQTERRLYLIRSLLNEKTEYKSIAVPYDGDGQRQLLRSLVNVRMSKAIDDGFLKIQDEYLQEELRQTGITKLPDLTPIDGDLYLWQGDITNLHLQFAIKLFRLRAQNGLGADFLLPESLQI